MFMELQRAVDDGAEVNGLFLRRGRTGKFQEILDDAGRAARLAMCEVLLTVHRFVQAFALSDQFGDTEYGRQRLVQFVRDAAKHMADGGRLLRLNWIYLQPLQVRDVAAGEHDTV